MGLKRYRLPLMPSPRRWRPEWLPWFLGLRHESEVHPHVPEEHAEQFLAYGVASTEIEVLNWLHATVCLVKPQCILETGTAGGIGTIALASACRSNGFGVVHSLEISPGTAAKAQRRLNAAGLAAFAQVHCADSLEWLRATDLSFQFAFFDSLTELRPQEFAVCRERGLLTSKGTGPIAVFHDTSAWRTDSAPDPTPEGQAEYRRLLFEAAGKGTTGSFESVLSRGFVALFLPPEA